MTELYPGRRRSRIGPAIENGFYYDFDFPDGVVDLRGRPARDRGAGCVEHVEAAEPFVREELAVAVGARALRRRGPALQGRADRRPRARRAASQTVSLYTNGPFTDLCRGPHAPSTGASGVRAAVDRRRVLARGLEAGRCSPASTARRSSRRRSSRRTSSASSWRARATTAASGRELGLFHFSELAPGSAFWTPHGTTLWNTLRDLAGELTRARGYAEVKTPQLYDAQLWRISGHWDKYRDNMFVTADDERPLALKPMNCPGHCVLYGMARHSYRDLPVRYAEPGLLHRNEPSGALHGLLRVRHFAQDDAHIFCTEEQIRERGRRLPRASAWRSTALFGFETRIELSTRPEVRIGDDALWDRAEAALAGALDEPRPRLPGQRRATARSTGRRSTCT